MLDIHIIMNDSFKLYLYNGYRSIIMYHEYAHNKKCVYS